MSTFASSLVLPLMFITVAYISEALIMPERYFSGVRLSNAASESRLGWSDRGSLVRTAASPPPLPNVCRPQTIDPSVECGCSVFRPDYEGEPEYEQLEDACNEEINSNVTAGFEACSEPDFEGTNFEGRSFVRRSGGFRITLIRDYFKSARLECRPAAASSPSRPIRSTRAVWVPGDGRGMHTSRPEMEELNSDPGSTIFEYSRIPTTRTHKKLRDFCMITLQRGGIPKRKTFCICCPRDKKCRKRR